MSSTPIASPRPRTSPIHAEPCAASRSRPIKTAPTSAARPANPSASMVSSTASAALAEAGLPCNVWKEKADLWFMTRSGPTAAEIGSPPPSPLPKTMMSGTKSSCSKACSRPLRASPTLTSSHIVRMPWRAQSRASRAKNPGGGTIRPPSAWIGSRKNAATSSGGQVVANSSSTCANTASPVGSPLEGRYGSGYGTSVSPAALATPACAE